LTEQLKWVSAQVEQLKTERDAAQSKLSERQSEFEAMQNDLAKAKEATEQANTRATELESAGANTAKETETERNKLQAALDQANTEIERLKSELDKQKSSPPEQGEPVSPAPGREKPCRPQVNDQALSIL
jgi:chromosome segregation ATPase